jgi:hypothetical protein
VFALPYRAYQRRMFALLKYCARIRIGDLMLATSFWTFVLREESVVCESPGLVIRRALDTNPMAVQLQVGQSPDFGGAQAW